MNINFRSTPPKLFKFEDLELGGLFKIPDCSSVYMKVKNGGKYGYVVLSSTACVGVVYPDALSVAPVIPCRIVTNMVIEEGLPDDSKD